MKTRTLLLALLTLGVSGSLLAQNTQEPTEGTAKVKIIKNINGEVTVIEKEVPISDKSEIDQMLKDLNISEELGDEENIEIIIRQGKHPHPMPWMEKYMEVDDRPLLGVYVGSTVEKKVTNDDGEETIEISEGDGTARISGVVPESGAEKAGLQEGDVITGIDDHAISNYETLVEALGNYKVGDVVTVKFERAGVAQSVEATLGERQKEMHMFGPMDREMMGMPGLEHGAFARICDPDRGFLGVHIRNLEEGEDGVLVTSVIENTTASEMGLQEGDIIYEVNDKVVTNTEELREAIGSSKAGEEMKIEYLRDGIKEKGSATLKKCDPSQCIPGDIHGQIMRSLEGIDWEEFRDKFNEEEFQEHMRELEQHLGDIDFDVDLPGSADHRVIAIMIRVDAISAEDKELLQKNNPGLDLNSELDVDDLRFSPNPSNGQFSLDFVLSEAAPVHIRIFDPSGREVYSQRVDDFKGSYSNTIDISGNSDGTYFLVVEQGGKTFSRKVVIQ
jgi:hypothetical protein